MRIQQTESGLKSLKKSQTDIRSLLIQNSVGFKNTQTQQISQLQMNKSAFLLLTKQSSIVTSIFDEFLLLKESNDIIFPQVIFMPPKKADPEALKKEWEVYRESEEWKKLQETHRQIKSLNYISETSKDSDIDGKFQTLWDFFYELAVIMKIKPPFKKIEHEWIRSIYFGEKRKVDNKEPPCVFDGVLCEYEPVDGDSQHNLRQALIKKIYNAISDLESNFDVENYNKSRSQLKKGFTEFFNLMKSHIKKSFKVIFEEKLLIVLQPFSDLLEINMKLSLHELKYTTKEEQFVHQFKYDAIVDRYCVCLDKVLDILSTHHTRPVKFSIKPRNIFKKLAYTNLTKIQSFYLTPYRQAFDTMKQGLCALFATGINFWKVPIEFNKKFVEDLLKLIDWELIVERFFGNDLLRDQINFAADVLDNIAKANGLAEKYLVKQDLNSMELAVPRLLAFKTVQRMRLHKDRQAEIRAKELENMKLLGATQLSQKQQSEIGNNSTFNVNASGTKQSFGVQPELKTKTSKIEIKVEQRQKTQAEIQLQKLGRYWIWDNYCDEDFKNKVIEVAVEQLKHINKAVHQDIEDSIIREGMLPRKERQNEQLKSAAETLKHMKTMDNSLKSQNMRRPPELWNFPKVVEQQHKFRSIADPKKCYIDGRIQRIDSHIVQIGDYLRRYNQKEWNQLMRRVIDFFGGKPDPSPFSRVAEHE